MLSYTARPHMMARTMDEKRSSRITISEAFCATFRIETPGRGGRGGEAGLTGCNGLTVSHSAVETDDREKNNDTTTMCI